MFRKSDFFSPIEELISAVIERGKKFDETAEWAGWLSSRWKEAKEAERRAAEAANARSSKLKAEKRRGKPRRRKGRYVNDCVL